MKPLLSILIPTVLERSQQLAVLMAILAPQAIGRPVEILSFCDNCQRTIGLKRQSLLDISRGKYVAFCDDDDSVADDYIATLCDMAKVEVDVLCFNQLAKWNEHESLVEFRLDFQPGGQFNPSGITQRFPWHVCAWNRKLAQQCVFTDKNWGEDADWVAQAFELAKTEAYNPKTLHFYTHRDDTSLAVDTRS